MGAELRPEGIALNAITAGTSFPNLVETTIHTVNITGGTAGTVTLYDNTSATGVPFFNSAGAVGSFVIDWTLQKGLFVVMTAATNVAITAY